VAWTPPERPAWLTRLNMHSEAVGGGSHLISLDPRELIETAIASTGGLDDFGHDEGFDWHEWYELLVNSLDTESSLHLVGRLLARHDLLRCLRNRLLLAELWERRPEVLEAPLLPPSFVIGTARSGTSILSELLALDPAARNPAMWEMLHPVEATRDDRLRPYGHAETVFMEDVAPEYAAMHENSGDLPNECIFIMAMTFLSDQWSGCHSVPSYTKQQVKADFRPVYAFHEKVLKTLQLRGAEGCTRWGLKAPSHLQLLEELFSVYPEALAIRIHRDPLKSLPSTTSLMGSLKRMRCEEVDMTGAAQLLAVGNAYMLQQEIEKRADGRVPEERFIDVRYHDLMRDPSGTIGRIYRRAGWDYSDEMARRVDEYIRNRPRGKHGKHAYTLESMGFDREAERERFHFYCEHYDIPEED
jgi:hypothetical protein